MKYKGLHIGNDFSVRGNIYTIGSVLTYGQGLLRGCRFFVFTPANKNLPTLCAMEWHDGHIDRLKPYIRERTVV